MNFNNMTNAGNCDRNKLGQLLVANIAALLNKKGESESESESERKSERKSEKKGTTPVFKASGKKGLGLFIDQFNADKEGKGLADIQQEEENRRGLNYQQEQQDQQYQHRVYGERGQQLPGVQEGLAQNAESFTQYQRYQGQISDEQRRLEELASASVSAPGLQSQLQLPDVLEVTQAEKTSIEAIITNIGGLLNIDEKLDIPADATYEDIMNAAKPLIDALGIEV